MGQLAGTTLPGPRNELDPISIGKLAIRRDEILDELGLRAKVGQGRPVKNGETNSPLKTTSDIAREIDSLRKNNL